MKIYPHISVVIMPLVFTNALVWPRARIKKGKKTKQNPTDALNKNAITNYVQGLIQKLFQKSQTGI